MASLTDDDGDDDDGDDEDDDRDCYGDDDECCHLSSTVAICPILIERINIESSGWPSISNNNPSWEARPRSKPWVIDRKLTITVPFKEVQTVSWAVNYYWIFRLWNCEWTVYCLFHVNVMFVFKNGNDILIIHIQHSLFLWLSDNIFPLS